MRFYGLSDVRSVYMHKNDANENETANEIVSQFNLVNFKHYCR